MNNDILQAIIQSIKTYPTIKVNDIANLGKVFSIYNGQISSDQLLVEAQIFISKGYFVVKNHRLHITQLGIDAQH